jgi:heat-inducible transcriptional repressor
VKQLKSLIIKRTAKYDRERKVLLGLIEHHIKTGKPVGSTTLKESEFDNLSSATIRNYFAKLEEEGYLSQQHSSGGRLPTNKAYRFYAEEQFQSPIVSPENESILKEIGKSETHEIGAFLPEAAEILSSITNNPVFLSAPRFDHDFVSNLKLMPLDHNRCLCVLITNFGVIKTEVLHIDRKISSFSYKRMEAYFNWRLTEHDKPENLSIEEELIAQKFYNELMVRYIVGYSNFTDEEIFRTGFSKLLIYPEMYDISTLSKSLALFENVHGMRLMLKECTKLNKLKFWIGEDLAPFSMDIPECTVIAAPYHINEKAVGAIGLLTPIRVPYGQMFGAMLHFAQNISEALTRNIYKFKITYRRPQDEVTLIKTEELRQIDKSRLMLLENQSQ